MTLERNSKFEQEKKSKNFYHHYLLLIQLVSINDQSNATFSALTLNYVCVNFVCIKSCTTLLLCNKVDLLKKDFILQSATKKAPPHKSNCLENFCWPHNPKVLFS